MDELTKRYQQLLDAYQRLLYMTTTFKKLSENKHKYIEQENELITHRDALIQRFEFCYDLTWKFLKLFLKERHSIEANSPRAVFLECYRQKILTEKEAGELIFMIDDRNETAHIYDERKIDIISLRILNHYNILDSIVKKININ